MFAKTGGGGSSGGGGGSGGNDNTQNHHRVPHSNSEFNHQNHSLVKQAKVNLKKHPENQMKLGNHAGRHSRAYHIKIKQMMDEAYNSVAGQGKDAAVKALKQVYDDIDKKIADGTLKPYTNKDVWIP